MNLILDTHVLAWITAGDPRLRSSVTDTIRTVGARLFVSAVTAWEYADLHQRGRLPRAADYQTIASMLTIETLGVPADLWRRATELPDHHRDPVDRMLIAHAIHADLTLVTADKTMREYPVRSLW